MKNLLPFVAFLLVSYTIFSQVGIGNTNPNASLDISASDVASPTNTDGLLIPRIDDFPLTNPTATQDGMMVFITGDGASAKGFYYWDQDAGPAAWVAVTGGSGGGTLDEAYDFGGAGVGRTITATDGAVSLEGEDGFQVTGTYGSGDNIALSGSGTRMFFNPRKAAFRAGGAGNTEWDNANIGDYSIAFGFSPIASGFNSTAFGEETYATGPTSTAFGDGSTASGNATTAFGGFTTASGNTATAFGRSTTASGDYATVFGLNSTASGERAVAFGSATASGGVSTAFGSSTASGINTTSFGSGTASGEYASAFGLGTRAEAYGAMSLGRWNNGSGTAASWVATDAIFEIGNGIGNLSRSNAFTVYKNGEVEINDTYKLPTADGTNGQVMTTNGAGIVTFQDAAGDADWYEADTTTSPTSNAAEIFTNGNVGIGISNPDNPLHIGTITPFDLSYQNTGQDGVFINGGGDNSGNNAIGGSISFGPPATTRGDHRKSAIASVQTGGDVDHTGLAFYVHGNAVNQSPMVEAMRITHARNVGINNAAPSANLDVIGTMQFEDGNEAAGFVLGSDANGNASWIDPATIGDGIGAERINDLTDGKSDVGGANDGSSVFLGINAGAADDGSDNHNVGVGFQALEENIDGENNVAIGYLALTANQTGGQNTAVGQASLFANIAGTGNTGIGYHALFATTGSNNTAVGNGSLGNNMVGDFNAALGTQALTFNTAGSNTAMGYRASYSNNAGTRNAAFGLQSLNFNVSGNDNVAVGYRSGYTATGSGNVYLGSESGNGATGDNKLFIENTGADEDNALIYGEFGTNATTTGNILRTNGELQIGNPTGTGYALPTNQGTANDVLTSNGDGTTTWAAPAPLTNLEYPDGFSGLVPVLVSNLLTTSYTVPAGQNFYITNIYSNNTGASVTINGAIIAYGGLNSAYTPVTKPIIAGPGDIISTSIDQITINGFLVTAGINPITQGVSTTTSYTVPAGRTLIILSVNSSSNTHSFSIVEVDGNVIYNGSGNDGAVSAGNFLTSFNQPLFIGAGSVLTSVSASRDYNINGYLIDN